MSSKKSKTPMKNGYPKYNTQQYQKISNNNNFDAR